MRALSLLIIVIIIGAIFNSCSAFLAGTCYGIPSRRSLLQLRASPSPDDAKSAAFDVKVAESAVVSEGLTHIKNNKYAPPAELAATMTPEEFRAYIYKAMREAERTRIREGGGQWGSAVSDSYIESLSGGPKK